MCPNVSPRQHQRRLLVQLARHRRRVLAQLLEERGQVCLRVPLSRPFFPCCRLECLQFLARRWRHAHGRVSDRSKIQHYRGLGPLGDQ